MKTDIKNIKSIVQQALDELFVQHLIPFKLTAYRVIEEGIGEYVVRFHDGRIHSMAFFCAAGSSFKEVARAAALDRVKSIEKASSGLARAVSSLHILWAIVAYLSDDFTLTIFAAASV